MLDVTIAFVAGGTIGMVIGATLGLRASWERELRDHPQERNRRWTDEGSDCYSRTNERL